MQRRIGQDNPAEDLTGPMVERTVTLDRIAVLLGWPALEAVLDGVHVSLPPAGPRIRARATARPAAASPARRTRRSRQPSKLPWPTG